MMIRLRLKVALYLVGGFTLALMAFVWAVQAAQPPLPALVFAHNQRLYWTQVGCGGLFANCDASGRAVVDDLYSLGVSLWSPDGRWLAVHRNTGWTIYEAGCLRTRTDCNGMLLDPSFNESRPTWAADSSALLAVYANGTVLQRRPASCWQQPETPCVPESVFLDQALLLYQPNASVDGERVILSDLTGSAFIIFYTRCFSGGRWDCANPDNQRFILTPKRPASWPTFSRDGRSVLLYADTSGVGVGEQLFVMDVNYETFQQITFREGASLYPAWTDDAQIVAFSGFATAASRSLDLYLLDRRTNLIAPLVRGSHDATFPTWQPQAAGG